MATRPPFFRKFKFKETKNVRLPMPVSVRRNIDSTYIVYASCGNTKPIVFISRFLAQRGS